MAITYASTKRGYANLWRKAEIKPERRSTVLAKAKRIIELRDRYEKVSEATGVPWFWIGVAHNLESGLNFSTHLHNGDSLRRRTVRVPKNRPNYGSGPYTWDESAIDALRIKKLQDITDWNISRCLFELERYNGFGYFYKGVNSPYLWNMTTLQQRGKYVRDGVFDPNATSQQIGAVAMLKALVELGAVSFVDDQPDTDPADEPDTTPDPKPDPCECPCPHRDSNETENYMSELVNKMAQFKGIAPLISRELAGDNSGLAVKILAEEFNKHDVDGEPIDSKPEAVLQKMDTASVSTILAVLPIVERLLVHLTTGSVGGGQNKDFDPFGDASTDPVFGDDDSEPTPTKPEPGIIDKAIPLPMGLKTVLGLVIYVGINLLELGGVVDNPQIVQVVEYVAGFLAGAGMIAKVDRYLKFLPFKK